MTTITIMPTKPGTFDAGYVAIAGKNHSVGKTAGQALDALIAQLQQAETGTVLIQNLRPDTFFNAQQLDRLQELMAKWHAAIESNTLMAAEEQRQLEALVEDEVIAAGNRAAALAHGRAS
jgi:hypothetical protein